MLIKDVYKVLLEYNQTKTNTTLAGQGGNKAAGKNFDNITAGITSPYSNNEYETKYEQKFPQLANLVKSIKQAAVPGDKIVPPAVMKELNTLFADFSPRADKEGNYSLPFGDGICLKVRGNIFYIGSNKEESLKSDTASAEASDITK